MFASFSDLLQLQVTIHSYDVFTVYPRVYSPLARGVRKPSPKASRYLSERSRSFGNLSFTALPSASFSFGAVSSVQ